MTSFIFLLIEFIDELVFGFTDSAWPLIRQDLGLNYVQIGLALSLPGMIATFIEPFLGVLGDVWKRRVLILGGGIFFVASLFLTAASRSYIPLLLSFVLFFPSSGAFVSLSQASLMDIAPERHEQNMARWTFAGSLGVVVGPLLLSLLLAIGFGWQPGFLMLGLFSTVTLLAARKTIPREIEAYAKLPSFGLVFKGLGQAFQAVRNPGVVRWLVLLEFSDLMLDVLYGFLALYFVDVAGFSAGEAALAVAVWTGLGLLGDFILIPLVERVPGLAYLRWSVALELVLFPAFLLAPTAWVKLVLVGLMGFFNAGWYAILKGNLYSSMPGQSGSVMALDNVSGFFGKLLPFGVGVVAQAYGLQSAMWLLLAGPLALFFFLPRKRGQ
ncbi:MAG TPA: MFS transporter [Anaerolineales bacterium]